MKYFLLSIVLCFGQILSSQNKILISSLTGSTSELYEFYPSNCNVRRIVGIVSVNDIAMTPNGTLYGAYNDRLIKIDTFNGKHTTEIKTEMSPISGLEAVNDSILIGMIQDGDTVHFQRYNVNSKTFLKKVGRLFPYHVGGDLVWYDNSLYAAVYEDVLLKLTFNADFSDLLSFKSVSSIPKCEALVIRKNPDGVNSLIGFGATLPNITGSRRDSNAYHICHLNSATSTICKNLNTIGGISGATSARLAVQNPEPTACYKSSASISNNTNSSPIELFQSTTSITLKAEEIFNQLDCQIYNINGKLVYKIHLNQISNLEISTKEFIDGLYFIRMTSNDGALYYSKKIVINH